LIENYPIGEGAIFVLTEEILSEIEQFKLQNAFKVGPILVQLLLLQVEPTFNVVHDDLVLVIELSLRERIVGKGDLVAQS